jgi:Amt family ammonium transporter
MKNSLAMNGVFTPLLALIAAFLLTIPTLSAQEPEKASEPPAPAVEAKAEEKPTEEKAEEKPAEEKPAEEAAPAPPTSLAETIYAIDNMMLFLAAVLVIFMQAGFSLVECGLNGSKNAVNIMFKNYMDFCIGALLFFFVGYGLMYPGADDKAHIVPNWLGFAQVGVPTTGSPATAEAGQHPLHPMVDFLFQVAFCATAATIVSGSVAGRIKVPSYLIYTAVISGLIYPVSGMWHWGKGWIADMGFVDFAGSVVVHAVGGFAGLAGAIALGPRIGRFVNGKPVAMPGHNIPMATLGVFVLIIGWYGFNPGSQLAFVGQANTDMVLTVAVNTTLALCTGSVAAMILAWGLFKKPDLTFILNGGLAGLVSITANCHCVTQMNALLIGAIGGVIVTFGVLLLDKLQIDDPVGAFPVHGLCGVWGGIATGLFGVGANLTTQLIGTGAIVAWALGTSLVLFFALKVCGLLRVHAEEEIAGLDISEHGMYAYPQQVVALESSASGYYPSSSHSPAMAAKPSTEAV